jgi:hypothetical protein
MPASDETAVPIKNMFFIKSVPVDIHSGRKTGCSTVSSTSVHSLERHPRRHIRRDIGSSTRDLLNSTKEQ